MAFDTSILDVSDWELSKDETVGASVKAWLKQPGAPSSPTSSWLFKPVVIHADGSVQGGDWAEFIASTVAAGLGVPSAEIRMSQRGDEHGTLSRNVRIDARTDCFQGSLWLDAEPEVSYRASNSRSSRRSSASDGYTLQAIAASLRKIGAPPQAEGGLKDLNGFDNFCGFLLLDAAISNRDRHEQNWSVLRSTLAGGESTLAAAYDNEASFGFNLTDANRVRLLAKEEGLHGFVRKGTAWRYDWSGEPAPDLVTAAMIGLSMSSPAAKSLFRERIFGFNVEEVVAAIEATPRMSEAARNFSVNLLTTNLERLRDGLRDTDTR